MPPVVDMLERGIPVAISTDGSGSADNQNILAAARLASQYQKARYSRADYLPALRALEMITVEPARILRIDAGSLAPGKHADMVVLSLSRPNMTPTRLTNLVENLIWASDGSEVRTVIAGGRVVRDGDQYLTLDAERILRDVSTLSREFDRYQADAPKLSGTGANV
jgi:5-methylthioadenosine/S-adenosylhomocysteine deaminase